MVLDGVTIAIIILSLEYVNQGADCCHKYELHFFLRMCW